MGDGSEGIRTYSSGDEIPEERYSPVKLKKHITELEIEIARLKIELGKFQKPDLWRETPTKQEPVVYTRTRKPGEIDIPPQLAE